MHRASAGLFMVQRRCGRAFCRRWHWRNIDYAGGTLVTINAGRRVTPFTRKAVRLSVWIFKSPIPRFDGSEFQAPLLDDACPLHARLGFLNFVVFDLAIFNTR